MTFPKRLIKTLIVSALLLLNSLIISTVSAKEIPTISITRNYQTFIDYSKNTKLKTLINSPYFEYSVTKNSNIDIIQRDETLIFVLKNFETLAQENLEITYKGASFNIPLSINVSKDMTDYTIQNDMYELSLQKKSLSCESSATSDILESILVRYIHEDDVISKLPVDISFNKLPIEKDGKVFWGNPNKEFVGLIANASQKSMTGYGVYEKPVANVYNQYGLETEILNRFDHNEVITPKSHLQYILRSLSNGKMVQLWGDWCTRPEYDDGVLTNTNGVDVNKLGDFISSKNGCYNVLSDRSLQWTYVDDDGQEVLHRGLDGQHAFVLLGWKGDIENPTHIRVWDTDTGYHLYQTVEWMRKWEAMDYRSIIIDKKDSN